MKHIIVGTAGHIDHGKTTLIKALTGRNTDRWEEEQRRGITIDLGFTYFDLPSGNRVGIIDVPGHEKFIGNMTAGVVGMDLVLLVVAADEGIMPQTREHMDILHLLGVSKCIVVLNKCDLVDEEWLELVKEEMRDEFKSTFLEKAPVIPVSAQTGEGISALVAKMDEMTSNEVETKNINTIPRLPIDRVFSLSGFGTVITGTLLSGTIKKEDALEMYPILKECRIRSIQVHGEDTVTAYAGQRVAINISNVKKSEIKRGCVLSAPNNMKNTDLLDARLEVLKSSKRVLTNHSRLHLFTGTDEVLCRVVLLDKDEIGPGESGFVQFRLEREIAVREKDRFIVRFYSPMETIGGGMILESNPKIKKRFKDDAIEELKQKESGSSSDVIYLRIKEQKENFITIKELAKVTARTMIEVETDVHELESDKKIVMLKSNKETFLITSEGFTNITDKLINILNDYEKLHPYRFGMKKAEVITTHFKDIKRTIFDLYIESCVNLKLIERIDEFVHTNGYEVKKDDVYNEVRNKTLKVLDSAGYDFIRYTEIEYGKIKPDICNDIINVMLTKHEIVKLNDEFYSTSKLINEAADKIKEELKKDGIITIAQVRDIFNTTRKSAKPILEYMDYIKVTKKTGAESERVSY
ncbi:MAG: selenocysteine-specific translation elongation factor [Suipraeoptans sp.]